MPGAWVAFPSKEGTIARVKGGFPVVLSGETFPLPRAHRSSFAKIRTRSTWGLALLLLLVPPARAQSPTPGHESFRRATAALESGDARQARELFERALHEGYPKGPGYRALADAWLALDHGLLEARKALERSLEADPSSLEDWMLLVEINQRLGGLDAEMRARAAMREILRRDPTYEGVYGTWRRLYLDRKDAARVEAILASHLEREYDPRVALDRIDLLVDVRAYDRALVELDRLDRQPGLEGHVGPSSYYRGVALAGLGRDADGWRAYRRGIESARNLDGLARYYVDLAPLLTDEEEEAWPGWGLRRQKRFLLAWWNRRDPLPLTEVNERWAEHRRRMRFVLETFPFRKPVDLEKLTSLGGTGLGLPTLALRVDGRAMDDRAELYLRHGAPDMKAGVGDDECGFWYYRREGLPRESFAVNFRRSIGGGGGAESTSAPSLFRSNDCVFALAPTTDMGRGHFTPGRVLPGDGPRIQEEVGADLALAMGTESFPYRTDDRIPLEIDPATFAPVDGLVELVVYFGVPVGGEERMRYRKGLVLYDEDWNELGRRTEEMEYALSDEVIGTGEWAFVVDLFRVWVAPGTYHVAIQVDERDDGRLGVWVGEVEVDDPAADGFGLSDLVLAADISTERGPERFERYGQVVRTLPSRAFSREQELHLYYEIYGPGLDPRGCGPKGCRSTPGSSVRAGTRLRWRSPTTCAATGAFTAPRRSRSSSRGFCPGRAELAEAEGINRVADIYSGGLAKNRAAIADTKSSKSPRRSVRISYTSSASISS